MTAPSPPAPTDGRRVAEADPSARALVTRAPSDVLRLVVALALLVASVLIGVVFGDAVARFIARLLSGLHALPAWLVGGIAGVAQVAALVLVGLGLAVAIRIRSGRLLLSAVLAFGVGALVTAALVHLVDAQASHVVDATPVAVVGHGRSWSAAGLGGLAAVVAVVSPWVTRRWRRVVWAILVGVALAVFVSDPVSFNTLLAMLTGWAAGTAVVVIAGSPSHRPTRQAIRDGLGAVGVELARLEPARVDARGSTPYFGETTTGTSLFVKALGKDERSADMLFRFYRRLQPRDLGDEKPFSTLRRTVEHEALVSLAARDLGLHTPRLAALASAEPDGYVLAYESVDGRSLDRVDATELTDGVLDATWHQVASLRRHRIAHRDLRLANLFLDDDGQIWLIDFGFAELAASNLLLATDVAELLASSATTVGPERAVAAGVRTVGPSTVRSGLGRLDLPYLSGATRTALKADPSVLNGLRAGVGVLPA